MYWRFLVAFVLILFASYGCAPGATDSIPSSPPTSPPPADSTPVPPPEPEQPAGSSPSALVPRISPAELLQKMLNNADILVVDSRAEVEEEYENGHITGAIPVALSQITSGQWEPPADKNKEIVFYCT